MHSFTLVTYLPDLRAFDWGLRLEGFTTPTLVVAHPSLGKDLHTVQKGLCTVAYLDLDGKTSLQDALLLLRVLRKRDLIHTPSVLFSEVALLYQLISFDLVYLGLLQRALQRAGHLQADLSELVRHQGILFTLTVPPLDADPTALPSLETSPPEPLDPAAALPCLARAEREAVDINLVANQDLEGPTLHLVGDSHSMLTLTPMQDVGARTHIFVNLKKHYPNSRFDYQFTHHVGSKTMYGFSSDDEFSSRFLADMGLKPGDGLLFVFGEIDVRSHLFKHVSESLSVEALVEDLVAKYTSKLLAITDLTTNEVYVMGAIPPMDGPNYRSESYPIQGTLAQRVHATRLLNRRLAASCTSSGIGYFELNDLYELEDGSLDHTQSDYFCHVGYHYQRKAIDRMIEAVGRPKLELVL